MLVFTDQSPPPITPNSARKLPTMDYAPGALIEAASFLLPGLRRAFLVRSGALRRASWVKAPQARRPIPPARSLLVLSHHQ